jgi:hypothetical protein
MPSVIPTLTPGRQPFEIALLAVAALSGATGLLIPGAGSRTINELFPGTALIFHGVLLLAALVSGAGLVLNPPTAPLVERVGMLILAGSFLAYGVGVFVSSTASSTGGIVISGFGLAALARAVQITRDLRRLQQVLREQRP